MSNHSKSKGVGETGKGKSKIVVKWAEYKAVFTCMRYRKNNTVTIQLLVNGIKAIYLCKWIILTAVEEQSAIYPTGGNSKFSEVGLKTATPEVLQRRPLTSLLLLQGAGAGAGVGVGNQGRSESIRPLAGEQRDVMVCAQSLLSRWGR